jgi:hypothetical protein
VVEVEVPLMKYLMGVVLAGHSKDYMLPKFLEMLEHVVYPDRDVDVCFVVDEYREELRHLHHEPTVWQLSAPEMKNSLWATEIVYYGKEALRKEALDNGFDALIWQGIDCLYESPESFQRLKKTYEEHGGMVGALVAGRNRPNYAVCRDFITRADGSPTRQQEDIGSEELLTLIEDAIPFKTYGYPGSDATFVSRQLLENVSMDGYEHWHLRPNKDQELGELGPEEWFTYRMIKTLRHYPLIEPRVRPWHCHETGLSCRFPGETTDLSKLHWN